MVNKTILITGSNGFIGSSLLAFLLQKSFYKIIGVSKGECRTPAHPNFKYLNVDLTHTKEVLKVFQRYQPNVVVHCAAISQVDVCEENPDLCADVNVNATKYLVHQSSKFNAQFIFLSSDFIFDGTQDWVDENTIPNPISVYGKSKLMAEEVVKNSSVKWAIIRPVLVYGFSHSASRSNIFTWVMESLKNENHIKVVEDQFRTPTFVLDVVSLIISIIENKAIGVFNLGGSEGISVLDFAQQIANISQLDSRFIHPVKSDSLENANLRPKSSCFIISREIEEFGIEPIGIDEGIKKSFRQFMG